MILPLFLWFDLNEENKLNGGVKKQTSGKKKWKITSLSLRLHVHTMDNTWNALVHWFNKLSHVPDISHPQRGQQSLNAINSVQGLDGYSARGLYLTHWCSYWGHRARQTAQRHSTIMSLWLAMSLCNTVLRQQNLGSVLISIVLLTPTLWV